MKRPVVGVIGNTQRVENRFATQAVGERNMRAVADIAGAQTIADLLQADGVGTGTEASQAQK